MALPPLYKQIQAAIQEFPRANPVADPPTLTQQALTTWLGQIPATLAELPPTVRACGVEIHKHLHLLHQELLLWQAARQTDTKARRWQQLQQRLTTLEAHLQTFSQLLLEHQRPG
jgi:hypothetical protein